MCCDSSTSNAPPAPESSDLIAIIHPHQRQPLLAGRLRLSNRLSSSVTTTEWQSLHSHLPPCTNPKAALRIQIHRLGSQPLLHSDCISGGEEENINPVMHSFNLDLSGNLRTEVPGRRFDLGVGGDGVVGRMISVRHEEFGVLGWGVIGRI